MVPKNKFKKVKNLKKEFAKKNIELLFDILESRKYKEFDKIYIKKILKLSESFNIRLNREQKLKFCKKCYTYFDVKNREIRVNPETHCIEYICKNCGNVKKICFKKEKKSL